MGPTLGGGVEPGRAYCAWPSPRPAQRVIFQITGPDPTRSVRFQSHAPSAGPGPRYSYLEGRLPGLAREIFRIFSLYLRAVSPPPQDSEATTCSFARTQRVSLGSHSLSTVGIRSRVCHAPIPAFVYHWCRVGYVVP